MIQKIAQKLYANIIIDISHEKVDRPFQYIIPDRLSKMIEVGMKVQIPFGRGNTIRTGYVIEITERPEFDPMKQKEIQDIVIHDTAVEANMIKLALWIKEQYGSTMIMALKTVLPVKQKMKQLHKKEIVSLITKQQAVILEQECIKKHQSGKARILHELARQEKFSEEILLRELHVSISSIVALEKQNIIKRNKISYYRNPFNTDEIREEPKKLSSAQQNIVSEIEKDISEGIRKIYLIHGITGSGKTEVYMELIADCIKRKKQAIVLIPEIALTYQTVLRFYKRFGNRVSVMNSTLSAGEKSDQCERAKCGEIDVIIGPRSALFTPFPQIGLIVIDEEHEPSYKSETMPKYHARETAIYLASLHGASVVLGSATPSVDSYYKAEKGLYQLFQLTERVKGNVLPEVYIADMRRELRAGNRSMFSRRLQELMEERLQRKEQIILFLNRRGYAGFVSCRNCGYVVKCPHCDVSLSEHKNGKMVCHYCGYEQPAVKRCPSCGSKYIMGFKAGTEQVEEKLLEMYPKSRILRMDGDTTKTKESYQKILSAFSDGKADILLGTQMIVKGHDFPNVTLVGALAADMSLFVNDYRASERTFQLLTQAAGRAGRGEVPGEVVIQTYQPDNYSIVHAATQNYQSFYEEEILFRELASYPPVAHMLAVLVTAREKERAEKLAEKLAELVKKEKMLIVIGPTDASVSKINDCYRTIFYVKSLTYDKLILVKNRMEDWIQKATLQTEQIQFDFNPMATY